VKRVCVDCRQVFTPMEADAFYLADRGAVPKVCRACRALRRVREREQKKQVDPAATGPSPDLGAAGDRGPKSVQF
jgi:hypothetical protein